jgi:prepilin-type N-terminal cleavage/methylation domain-containing protein
VVREPGCGIRIAIEAVNMSIRLKSLTAPHGFSLVEMIVVGALVVVGSAVAIPVTMRMVNHARGDSAVVVTATFLEQARNRAVAERRNMVITFPADNQILVQRVEVPGGALTTISTLTLEGAEEFSREGLPDTPDNFGGAAAINFTGVAPVMFTSDGSLIDNQGDVTNGTIYVVRPGNLETARAVTIWGVTGMMRTWKWTGSWSQ